MEREKFLIENLAAGDVEREITALQEDDNELIMTISAECMQGLFTLICC